MSVARIAYRYAKSLLDLSVETNALEEVHNDVQLFLEATKNRGLELMLESPIIKSDRKQKVLDTVFGPRFHKITNNFFQIIVRKGREKYLKAVAIEFEEQYKKHKHISSVTLTTASAVGDDLVQAITDELHASKQTDTVIELETKVNPKLLGGFILEFDNKLFDASVAHKLELLKREFSINEYIKNM